MCELFRNVIQDLLTMIPRDDSELFLDSSGKEDSEQAYIIAYA